MIKADKGALIELSYAGYAETVSSGISTLHAEENGFNPIAYSYGRIRPTGYLLQGKKTRKLYLLLTTTAINQYDSLLRRAASEHHSS